MSRPTLSHGSSGLDVKDLQQLLSTAGYDPGPVDGIFGDKTEGAVKVFQLEHGLSADGIAGPATWGELETESAEPVPANPGPTIDWATRPGNERMYHVMQLLVETYEYPTSGAAGLVGNLWAESGVIPNRVEGSSSSTPMRSRDFSGVPRDFTAQEIMARNSSKQEGPAKPGVGLAQWTSPARRTGLFSHEFAGLVLGADILFDMDAQVDYLQQELETSYSRVRDVLVAAETTVDDACDEIVYSFEVPGSILEGGRRLPRGDSRVQEVFRQRRSYAQNALKAYQKQD
ncbi:phage tail tip lysozyme [Arthrobacter sp. DNA4]|uniref:phage tail tip lysozyme n=1 Tax=Arthrobacter sp. DNA4 TaxID=2963432 RepID=UPI0020CF5D09|nr:phage tail tip lysozyme [Arthrobacter sp. DNA4]UTT71291.1 phage tail tip lysozyme [Arthrobacter sp. DNA4]